jgi:SAM-dependent methyltransferase
MWDDSRAALTDLDLPNRRRVLDVGCGTGELTAVLREEAPGAEVVGVDADRALLAEAVPTVLQGDATRLPLADDAVDLVAYQALLVNLPDPAAAVAEFARVSSELVALVEPDNGAATVTSTVESEPAVTGRVRTAFLAGSEGDLTLGGAGSRELLADAGLTDLATTVYDHEQVVEPPYEDVDLRAARRKASGAGIADGRATLLAGGLDETAYDELRADWRAMGRAVVDQMAAGEYRRTETVPFHVTVGRVPDRSVPGDSTTDL